MEGWKQFNWPLATASGDGFHTDCPARTVFDHVTSRWGVWVLIVLREGGMRFSELHGVMAGVSEKMLAQTLRTLVRDGLVWREVEPSTPPRVTYGLTPLGEGTSEPLATLFDWIRTNAEHIRAEQAAYDAPHAG